LGSLFIAEAGRLFDNFDKALLAGPALTLVSGAGRSCGDLYTGKLTGPALTLVSGAGRL